MTEASAYTPPSQEPAAIAARLEMYISRHERLALDHVDSQTGIPEIQRGFMDGLLLHIRRLEHQMRCFILFLAAELIARGLVKPQPLALRPRREADPTAPSAEIRREDRELRLALSGQVRLNTFAITTPVIEGKPRRKPHGGKRPYTLTPDRLQPMDARYLLARYGRLSRVLLRADILAERLAGRALTVKLYSTSKNYLYLSTLHSLLAPEALWTSAGEMEDERSDLTSLHLMANEGLYAAGFPPGPDPRLRLPEFERWKPPRPGVCLL